jgi:hypothetical protein
MANIILNVIPFHHPEDTKTFGFYKEKKEGFYPIRKYEYPKPLWENHEEEIQKLECLYTDLTDKEGADFYATLTFNESFRFANHFYRNKIYRHFLNVGDVVEMGFVNDITVWLHDASSRNQLYNTYKKYTVRVQFGKVSRAMELALSYDGKSLVHKSNLLELEGNQPESIKRVIYQKEIYAYQSETGQAAVKHDLGNVYPILGKSLLDDLSIDRPHKLEPNKYIPYLQEINFFFNTYLKTDEFKAIIPLEEDFVHFDESQILRIKGKSNELMFGKNSQGIYQQGIEPKRDFLRFGPYAPSKTPNVRFIFIYHKPDKAKYVSEIFKVFKKGLPDNYVAFPPLQKALNQNFYYDESEGFEFENIDTAIQEIKQKIVLLEKKPNTQYVALYVSPIRKDERDSDRLEIYYRLKEVLLNNDITSQVIYKESIFNSSFKWYLPNIAIALLAKINGIPWRLDRTAQEDLVVGVGAFYSATTKTKYIGSTFCFNNDGTFQGFSCLPANLMTDLAGMISKAILKYVVDNHTQAKRLIIHFYKKISERELGPIMEVLHTFNWKIPVIVITINKTLSNDYVAFDLDSANLMPQSGSIMPIGYNQYLLFNNTRYRAEETVKDNPFPVKLTFSSQTPELLEDKLVIKELIDGVYQFSRMYWKSVRQQNLPVTIKYPEMAAEIFSHFDADSLPPFGQKNLWFL